jgi:gas vesicle protein
MDKRTESIQQDINHTQDSMTEKMEEIEGRMQGTAQQVRSSMDETVDRTVDNVKSSVGHNMEKFKDQVDVQQLVEERPWLMFGGSVLAGYMLGTMTESRSSRRHVQYDHPAYPAYAADHGRSHSSADDDRRQRYYEDEVRQTPAARGSYESHASHSSGSSRMSSAKAETSDFVDDVLDQFREEVDTLKDAAMATMTRVLRETLQDNMPQLAEEFERARTERQQYYAQQSSDAHLNTPQDQDRSTSIVEPAAAKSDAVPSSDAERKQQQDTSTSSILEPERKEKQLS